MRSYGDAPHPPVSPSSPQVGTISAQEMTIGRVRGRVTDVDQMDSLPRPWEIDQDNQMLEKSLEIRETRIATLRKDIENGHYSVEAEQVAEKIMEIHLLELFYSRPSR